MHSFKIEQIYSMRKDEKLFQYLSSVVHTEFFTLNHDVKYFFASSVTIINFSIIKLLLYPKCYDTENFSITTSVTKL